MVLILEDLDIEVGSAGVRVEREQLAQTDGSWRQRRCYNRRCCWFRWHSGTQTLTLSGIKAIDWFDGGRPLAGGFFEGFGTRSVHAFQVLVYPAGERVLGVPAYVSIGAADIGQRPYFFMILTSSARIVRSSDRISTFVFGVRPPAASLRGLKLSTLDRILFAVLGRRRMSTPSVLRAAVTSKTSLSHVRTSVCSIVLAL